MSGVTYALGRSLYVALTNRCNSVSLISSRGPGFTLPPGSGFVPLADEFEPCADEVYRAVVSASSRLDGAHGAFESVVFAGAGEPLLRLRTLEEAARLIDADGIAPLRVNTNGLVAGSSAEDVAARLRDARVGAASVALMTADPEQEAPPSEYNELMRPERLRLSPAFSLPLGHSDVCRFVRACIAVGISVECTAVASPGVDLSAARACATRLGATFRTRSWHP
ncbi:hypothetical protein AB1Y20_014917 [Prymnesium parvum]|uniref:Radical SAM core domain-containing protein n=1 Tax=Prymnesium parvum TaxID=97485 RepID=A0AB34JWV6_PRYPA